VAPEEQDRRNRKIMDAVNETGQAFLSHTVLRGRFCLRLAVGNLRTTRDHVARTWELIQETLG
jgi:glutamate/tyrosine decarboxylase-like PLP-dependent enzyme